MVPSQCLMDWGVVTPFAVFQHVFLSHSSLSTILGGRGRGWKWEGKKEKAKPAVQS